MPKINVMPASEKYASTLKFIKHESCVPLFIEKHLGSQAVAEFRKICQEGIRPVPEDAPEEEMYEIAYSNWIWMGKSAFRFVRQRMGDEGIRKFIVTDIEAYKRENGGPARFLLSVIRTISPGLAFNITANQLAYQLQCLSLYTVSRPDRNIMVLNVPQCKLLDFLDSQDLCEIGCRTISAAWIAEQFGIKMQAERQGNSCVLTFTPVK